MVTRFAPAPTGFLHLGHVVNALHVWGAARRQGGSVLLRIEDHDRQRSRLEYDTAIVEDLAWLGFQHDGDIVRQLSDPIHATGGLTILDGTLAPGGAVVKSAGFDSDVFRGTARVFDGERAAMDALEDGTITAGDVVVIRYEGPKGGPGMREMLAITGAINVVIQAL